MATDGRLDETKIDATVPLSARVRLAAGLRVPPAHREWALGQIRSEGWPVRQAFTRLFVWYPVSVLGVGILALFFFPGQTFWEMLYMPTLMYALMTLMGAAMGAWWPDFVRQRDIRNQLGSKKR